VKVLLTTHPGLGHLHPLIPLAAAIRDAGHEVAFACSASLKPTVERLGFRCFAAGLDWLESAAERAFPELVQTPLERQPRDWLVSEVFADVAAHEMVADLLVIGREWQPDLIVRDDLEFAGCIAAERLGLPHAAVSVETYIPAAIWEQRIGEQLAYVRGAYGLPPYPATAMLYRHLYLACVAPGMLLPEFPLPATAHHLRPLVFDQSDGELPAWIADLPDRPTIYVSLGTVFNRASQIFAAIIEGLRDEPVNVIITLGRDQSAARLGPLPPNVWVEGYIPQSLLLPHCDLAITHCGFQTTMSILSHGLPMIAIPLGATHPFRAIRCEELGLGRVLLPDRRWLQEAGRSADSYSVKQHWPVISPAAITEAVRAILADPAYRRRAEQVRAETEALPGPEAAVALLEQLVADHRRS
jgi:UDP:flavonoid glycosyltransferase YjiC (YdhE family)